MDSYHVSAAIQELWKYIARTNKYIDETAPWVLAKDDTKQDRLNEVLYNLVGNSINYTGEDKKIYVSALRVGEFVRVEVKDTGEGIEADKLALIWDRYYKENKAHKRAQVGTGLGLSIVKGVIELHGGKYGVISREGVGSVFWFELENRI